jgi:DNA replication protein DnaD
MNNGWIKLHRRLLDNPLWLSEKFTKPQAWVDLLLLANHSESFIIVRGIKVKIKRGQVGWSEPKLADRWGWSRSKVRNFLKLLENEQQIEQQKNNVTLIISILNYNSYQEKEQQNIQQKNSRRTAEEQQKDSNKNVKNVKNEKNIKKEIYELYESVLKFFPEKYKPKTNKQKLNWIDTLNKLVEVDGKDRRTIYEVIKWARNDEFWSKNFRSINKLRQKDKQDCKYFDVFEDRLPEVASKDPRHKILKYN